MSKNFEIIYKEFIDSKTFVLSRELLEDYKRQAAQAEQDRIVKLLEFELWETFEKSHNKLPAWATMELLITAIKGENE